jgi:hypothetical protein
MYLEPKLCVLLIGLFAAGVAAMAEEAAEAAKID